MDALQTLVNSLTKAEKRYFKMFASAFKTESELLKLFDTLDSDKELDDKALQKKTDIKNLPAARSNLRKLLLKTMRNYREGNSPRQQMRDTLSDIEFLVTKRLFTEAKKEINKARKVAEADGNYLYLMQLAVAESYTLMPTDKKEVLDRDTERIRGEIKLNIQAAAEVEEASVLQRAMATYTRAHDFDNAAARHTKGEWYVNEARILLQNSTTAYTKLINESIIASSYSYLTSKQGEAEAINHNIYRRFNENPQLKHIGINLYAPFLLNYAQSQVNNNSFNAAAAIDIIKDCDSLFANHIDYYNGRPDLLFEHQQRLTFIKQAYIANSDLDQSNYAIKDLEIFIKKHVEGKEFPTVPALASLQVSLLISLLIRNGQAAKAIDWLPVYFALDDAKLLKPLAFVTRLNEVFAFYFTGNIDIADTKANNLYKSMHEQEMLKSDYYINIGKLLRKLCKWNVREEKDRKELQALSKEFDIHVKEKSEYWGLYWSFFNTHHICRLIEAYKA